MRKLLLAGAALLVASCSDNSSHEAADGISTSSAPGVAWTFSYDFLLDDQRIEAVQERHAGRCEQLGPTRCRITGLRYSVNENEDISAMLEMAVQPSLARQFGRLALSDVRGVDGKLVRSEFNGEDVGSQVTQARTAGEQTSGRIADLQRRIEAAQAGSPERAELQRQLEALNARAAEQRTTVQSGEQRLAFTPITFNYYGEGGIPGFGGNPIDAAFKLMVSSFVAMISFTLRAIAVLLPWALLLGLLVLAWRSRPMRALRQWWGRYSMPDGYQAAQAGD